MAIPPRPDTNTLPGAALARCVGAGADMKRAGAMAAKQRMIHPEFFLNVELAGLSAHARLLFIGLWTLADRDGRLEDKPEKIKAQLFPYERVSIERLLTELLHCPNTPLERYESDGKKVLVITSFAKWQHIHPNEAKSKLPAFSLADVRFPKSLDNDLGRETLAKWLDYKKSRGESYKTISGVHALLNQFEGLTAAAFERAVNCSIGNNYAGVFAKNGHASPAIVPLATAYERKQQREADLFKQLGELEQKALTDGQAK